MFTSGEAVLRCEGCGVFHHPACWVTNGGCSTPGPHHSAPVAQAYGRDPGTPTSSGAGTPQRERPSFAQARPQREAAVRAHDPDDVDGPEEPAEGVIGADRAREPLQRARREPAPPPSMTPPRAPRRYDDSGRNGGPRTLPKVYGRRRVIDFWYIPAAIIVAGIIAIGVILGVEKLTGGSGNNKAGTAPSSTTTATVTANASATSSVAASATTPAGAVGTPGGTFTVGQKLTVTGTGQCLNIRPGPSTSGDAIACVPDGTAVTVTGGPQDAEGYTWWKVQTDEGTGWAAGNYLAASSAG